jgi:hypothetical protein
MSPFRNVFSVMRGRSSPSRASSNQATNGTLQSTPPPSETPDTPNTPTAPTKRKRLIDEVGEFDDTSTPRLASAKKFKSVQELVEAREEGSYDLDDNSSDSEDKSFIDPYDLAESTAVELSSSFTSHASETTAEGSDTSCIIDPYPKAQIIKFQEQIQHLIGEKQALESRMQYFLTLLENSGFPSATNDASEIITTIGEAFSIARNTFHNLFKEDDISNMSHEEFLTLVLLHLRKTTETMKTLNDSILNLRKENAVLVKQDNQLIGKVVKAESLISELERRLELLVDSNAHVLTQYNQQARELMTLQLTQANSRENLTYLEAALESAHKENQELHETLGSVETELHEFQQTTETQRKREHIVHQSTMDTLQADHQVILANQRRLIHQIESLEQDRADDVARLNQEKQDMKLALERRIEDASVELLLFHVFVCDRDEHRLARIQQLKAHETDLVEDNRVSKLEMIKQQCQITDLETQKGRLEERVREVESALDENLQLHALQFLACCPWSMSQYSGWTCILRISQMLPKRS